MTYTGSAKDHVSEKLNTRSRSVLRELVQAYMDTGEPVGSRTLAKRIADAPSPATIRNIMADLEDAGLLYSPHISAGRIPTENGLRFFIDGLLEIGNPSQEERNAMEALYAGQDRSFSDTLEETVGMVSGLSQHAALVVAPRITNRIKHIDFVSLNTQQALVILVNEDGMVENRLLDLPSGITPSHLREAANFMSHRFIGRDLEDVRESLTLMITEHRTELNQLSQNLVEKGLAFWSENNADDDGFLIVRGQANLLKFQKDNININQLEKLFEQLEHKKSMLKLINATQSAEGVHIFIGSDTSFSSPTGWSMVMSAYKAPDKRVLGAIGVIGPVHMNYGRIIPLIDYTAQIMERKLKIES